MLAMFSIFALQRRDLGSVLHAGKEIPPLHEECKLASGSCDK